MVIALNALGLKRSQKSIKTKRGLGNLADPSFTNSACRTVTQFSPGPSRFEIPQRREQPHVQVAAAVLLDATRWSSRHPSSILGNSGATAWRVQVLPHFFGTRTRIGFYADFSLEKISEFNNEPPKRYRAHCVLLFWGMSTSLGWGRRRSLC